MKTILTTLALIASTLSFASEPVEMKVQGLECELVGHQTYKKMVFAKAYGEMHFFTENGEDLSYHWDGFSFMQDPETKRIFIVYHDGGEATLEGADAYIDQDGTGQILLADFSGTKLSNCRVK